MRAANFLKAFAIAIVIYIIIVLLFGITYFLTGSLSYPGVSPIVVKGFWDSFYFSFVSFLTIGYGDIAPNCGTGKTILFIESIFSIGFNAIFAGYLAFQFLKRPDDLLISTKLFIRKSKKASFNGDSNYDIIIRVGNKGNQLIDCKGVLEFFVFHNNTRTTIEKFEREYRILEKTWNFKIRFYEIGNENKLPTSYKSMLIGFLFKEKEKPKQLRFSISGLDNTTGQVVSKTKLYELKDIEFIDSLVDVYPWDGIIRGKESWKYFDKSKQMIKSDKELFDKYTE